MEGKVINIATTISNAFLIRPVLSHNSLTKKLYARVLGRARISVFFNVLAAPYFYPPFLCNYFAAIWNNF
jgi:hypothetical protein